MTVSERLTELAQCLCAEVGDLCFCGVLPGGEAALDYAQHDCDGDCGQAWVRLVTVYPSRTLGQADETAGNCNSLLGYDVELGVVRCLLVGDDAGGPPDAAAMLASTEMQVADMEAMRRAVLCCTPAKEFLLGAYTPYGPEGGLVGGTWLVGFAD